MFKIGLKFSTNSCNLNRIKNQRFNRICLTTRCYKTGTNVKYKDNNKLHGSTGTLFTIGAITIGAIGTLTYAKNNLAFREQLEEWIPGTDRVIQIMFQEESSYLDYILNLLESFKNKIFDSLFGPDVIKPDQINAKDYKNLENYKPPKSGLVPTVVQQSVNTLSKENSMSNIELNKEQIENLEVVSQKTSKIISNENLSDSFLKLEKDAGILASKAISEFQKATYALQNYNKDVLNILECSDTTVEQKVWDRLKLAQEEKTKALIKAEKQADQAVETLKKLYVSIDNIQFSGTIGQKNIIKKNISNILSDVDKAKKNFEQEISNTNISEKYWKELKCAREKFQEELKILLPNINIEDKNLVIKNETFDLFILYMDRKVAFLQKELEKIQTVSAAKIKFALKSEGDKEKIQEAISLEVNKESKKMQENFEKKLLKEAKAINDRNREQLKQQVQIHADLLKEALIVKEHEMDHRVNRIINEKDEEYSLKTKLEMAEIIGKLRGIDEALIAYVEADKDADKTRQMWTALYGLVRTLNSVTPGASVEHSLKPLKNELLLVQKVSNDPFICNVIDAMPKEAFERGVYPDHILRKRFYKVEKIARRLALIPEQGAPMWAYFLSYLQSCLIIQNKLDPDITAQNVTNVNTTFSTFDILQRARYWMDNGSLELSMRYMTMLEGASRMVAENWIHEVQMMLEIQQSVQAMMFYTTAKSLAFTEVNNSQVNH